MHAQVNYLIRWPIIIMVLSQGVANACANGSTRVYFYLVATFSRKSGKDPEKGLIK